MRVEDRNPDTLNRPAGNSLQENYEKHDDAEATFLEQLPDTVTAEAFGIDKRHEDDCLIYDDKPDFRLHVDGEPQALVDVKSKSRDTYMLECNERHFHKYLDKSDELGVPAYVYFYNVKTDSGVMCDVAGEVSTTSADGLDPWPDGNKKARLETIVNWDTFIDTIHT